MSAPTTETPWYAPGLRFQCTQCGQCCSGAPGHVWVTPDELHQIARLCGLTPPEFGQRHLRQVGNRYSLLEKPGGDCEFLQRPAPGQTRCRIHAVRPVQCRTWPFWKSNVDSPERWRRTSRQCPGIDNGGQQPLPVIEDALLANGDLPL